ncbi:subtilisin-like protease [Dioscorea cayenensis subsp. rotundata]|uniref:Subtilisin-like protease n=1 Tax=Dioscorea cayennensis subsp. rotundata TaxID=55577 RepID=A0AB40BJ62_DIOCR|nr:subtilisin-like protease [Dioscorea cayenensis subsp. rotundata]
MNAKYTMQPRYIPVPFFSFFLLVLVNYYSTSASCHGFLLAMAHSTANIANLQTYIVHVQQPPGLAATSSSDADADAEREIWYKSFLPARLLLGSGEPEWLYAYHHVTSGFAVRLTEDELSTMKEKDGFLLAYPDRLIPLQTTYSSSFLGLEDHGKHSLWDASNYGAGIIIGVLDTGIAPNHTSFNDQGMPFPPAKWKGNCEFPPPAGCNKKLIGARNFIRGQNAMRGIPTNVVTQPPYDSEGHGTHTAGTAAGRFVEGAGAYGNAMGLAVGMAPRAHLAIYKVCSENGCPTSDIMAGLDAAVSDGVDVLSLSLGGKSLPFYQDGIAIGTFGAIQKGVFVSCAAGNSGPSDSTLSNEAPWILTVGASTMDRSIRTTVTLGNGQQFDGESLNQGIPFPATSPIPLVYAGGRRQTATCSTLSGVNVRGKVVVCDMGGGIGRVAKGSTVKAAGGVGMILANLPEMGYSTLAEPHVIPTSHVTYEAASQIKAYIKSAASLTANPVATITPKGTLFGAPPVAPIVAYFSSRGPSQASPNILKPDIIGPGVNVLAAWPFPVGPVGESNPFNVISGTSMSTPHLSGIAALLRAVHPKWSPAMIKSAIMTSSDVTGSDGQLIGDQLLRPYNLFATGVGHVNPTKASDPGLVFDIGPQEYIAYLCGLGYDDKQVSAVVRSSVSCSSYPAEVDLNYPSITVVLDSKGWANATRFVTNVGQAVSLYKVNVTPPPGVKVIVEPDTLSFTASHKVEKFTVQFQGTADASSNRVGSLTWSSGTNQVALRSPLLVVPSSSSSLSGSSVMAAKQSTIYI